MVFSVNARNEATKNGYQGLFVKDKNGAPLFRKNQVVKRWEEYFEKLLNERRDHVDFSQYPPVEGPVKKKTH